MLGSCLPTGRFQSGAGWFSFVSEHWGSGGRVWTSPDAFFRLFPCKVMPVKQQRREIYCHHNWSIGWMLSSQALFGANVLPCDDGQIVKHSEHYT